MEKIAWCKEQKKGITLIEKKPHLSNSYMSEAKDTLETMFETKGKWKAIIAYYACYNSIYSLLMKTGIKCEIHDCTIELMKIFGYEDKEISFVKKLKEKRIKNQYYLKKEKFNEEEKAKRFILKSEQLLENLSSSKIDNIREEINLL